MTDTGENRSLLSLSAALNLKLFPRSEHQNKPPKNEEDLKRSVITFHFIPLLPKEAGGSLT